MAKNFYNLPNAWNPGYVEPDSVLDEGLERRAFVTAMTPRGTYDDPSVGTGGYKVPRYVEDEGYGQGAFVTKWLPRGYYGPEIPHWLDQQFSRIVSEEPASGGGVVLKMEVLGDDAPPYAATRTLSKNAFERFGQRSAAALISSVRRLPEGKREAAMRKAMDAMDARLYARTSAFTSRLRARGVPPKAALAQGLAAGITEGMLAELARTGVTRSAPQARSLPGLGCYGCDAALGATDVIGKLTSKLSSGVTAAIAAATPTTAACPPGQTKYKWVEKTDTTPAHWERARVGEMGTCYTMAPSGAPGGVTVTETATGAKQETQVKPVTISPMVQIGPWVFSMTGGTITSHMNSVPAEWARFLADQLSKGGTKYPQLKNVTFGKGVTFSSKYASIDGALVGRPGAKIGVLTAQVNGSMPLVKVKHPTTGKTWGLYLSDLGQNGSGSFKLRFAEVEYNWLEAAFNWIAWVVGKVIDVVKDAVAAIAGMACQLVQQPGATAAAAAASGGTAAIGTAIAAGICQTPAPPEIPPPPASESNLLLPLGLAAGGLTALYLLTNKKKTA